METKYLRLRTPVELGSRFDDWQVCWLGGWAKHRLYYLVTLVRVPPSYRYPCLRFDGNLTASPARLRARMESLSPFIFPGA
jgi:hypothetical protein